MSSTHLNDKAKRFVADGNELLNKKKWADAARKYQKATEIDPSSGSGFVWSSLAMCFGHMDMYPQMKDAAQRCLDVNPKLVSGYINLAIACQVMREYDHGMVVLLKGLTFHPDNDGLLRLLSTFMEEKEQRGLFQQDTLEVEAIKKKLHYYGGLPVSGIPRIPKDTTYSRLKRTSLPNLSKKISKCRDEVKPVMSIFSSEKIHVKWLSSDKEVIVEGYLVGDVTPIITVEISLAPDAQNQLVYQGNLHSKWGKILRIEEKTWLVLLLSQRFLREKGCQINLNVLHTWIIYLLGICDDREFYKHTVDLLLIYADIIFNQNSNHEMIALISLAGGLQMVDDHSSAAGIYTDMLNAEKHSIRVGTGTNWSESKMYVNAFRAYNYADDFIKAESCGVALLRVDVGCNWDWDTVKSIMHSTPEEKDENIYHSPMVDLANLLDVYRLIQDTVLYEIRTDEMHCKLWKVYMLLLALFSCTGCPPSRHWSTKLSSGDLQRMLKQQCRKPEVSRQVVIRAFMSQSIEEYHSCILDCLACNYDLSQLLSVMKNHDPRFNAHIQAEFRRRRKEERSKLNKHGMLPNGLLPTGGSYERCKGCGAMCKALNAKECPCKMAVYCSKHCQQNDWASHRHICTFSKKK